MIAEGRSKGNHTQVVVIDIGNTSTAIGVWDDCVVAQATRIATSDDRSFPTTLQTICDDLHSDRPKVVVVGSVVPAAARRVAECVKDRLGLDVRVIGADVPLPIPVQVRCVNEVGVDRVCSAAAAFEKTGHACTVVSFGSAVTVDLVGDNGQFIGGAILPGARMQARALNAFTAGLPMVTLQFPATPIGNDTESAIQSGICHGIAGAVRGLVEAYATDVGVWPQVVGTGGDLELFMPHCDFVDSAVPDLCLMGIGLAWARHAGQPE